MVIPTKPLRPANIISQHLIHTLVAMRKDQDVYQLETVHRASIATHELAENILAAKMQYFEVRTMHKRSQTKQEATIFGNVSIVARKNLPKAVTQLSIDTAVIYFQDGDLAFAMDNFSAGNVRAISDVLGLDLNMSSSFFQAVLKNFI